MPRSILRLLPLVLFLFPAPLFSQSFPCNQQTGIIVTTDDPTAVAEICATADQAIAFLACFGMEPKRTIHVEITEGRIDSHGYLAYGSYDSRSDRIQLMSYEAILNGAERPQMYGEAFDKVHYRGAIAHEVAHAVVQHNLKSKPLSTGPQEYLAHATQLAVLPAERRAAVIRKMDIGAWESGDVISDIYMAIEPGKFAVKSYKHLTGLLDPLAFVQILLNAKWFYVYVP